MQYSTNFFSLRGFVWATNHCSSATRAHDSIAACSCQLHLLDRYSSVRPLFAMKSAIGEISFLRVWFGMSLRPGTSKPRTTAESPSKVSHEVCNWLNSSHVLSARALGPRAARKRLLRSLFQVRPEGTRSRLATKDSIGQKNW